jgi:hypothetical protein
MLGNRKKIAKCLMGTFYLPLYLPLWPSQSVACQASRSPAASHAGVFPTASWSLANRFNRVNISLETTITDGSVVLLADRGLVGEAEEFSLVLRIIWPSRDRLTCVMKHYAFRDRKYIAPVRT